MIIIRIDHQALISIMPVTKLPDSGSATDVSNISHLRSGKINGPPLVLLIFSTKI